MVFARAPWGEIQLETDGRLKGFSHRGKLFKIHYYRQTKSVGTSGDRRSETTNGWANYLDIGLQFFPPKKRLFWWSLRVNCEMSVIVDISR